MDQLPRFEILNAGLVGATFLWIGLMIIINGDRRASVTIALATAAITLSLFYNVNFLRYLFSEHLLFQSSAPWWLIEIASVGWYAAALYHSRDTFSTRRWPSLHRWLFFFIFWAGALIMLGATNPDLRTFIPTRTFNSFADDRSWITLLVIIQVESVLVAALTVYTRAWLIHIRAGEFARFEPHLIASFMFATVCLMGTVAALALTNSVGHLFQDWTGKYSYAIAWLGLVMALSYAAFLLVAITTNRKLLGRPVNSRTLLLRWVGLLGVLCPLLVVEVLRVGAVERRYDLLALVWVMPLLFAAFDWRRYRVYQRNAKQYQHFVEHSIAGWPNSDVEICRKQADSIFAALLEKLNPDAAYLELRLTSEEPFILRHRWPDPAPHPNAKSRYDVCFIEVGDQRPGFIALRGPCGIAYSQWELNLAHSHATSIAGLYLAMREARGLDELVVRRERERHAEHQQLERALHNIVGGKLAVIQHAAHDLLPADAELAQEIREAAVEAIVDIRNLLRNKLADFYPATLLREGLLAALQNEALPRYENIERVCLTLHPHSLTDTLINNWLSDELKRTLYGAIDEALRNAVKHGIRNTGESLSVQVRLHYDARGLVAEVEDNGVGFIPTLADIEGDGMGLRYHRAAIRLAGGYIDITSYQYASTKVCICLPTTVLRHGAPLSISEHPQTEVARSPLAWYGLMLKAESHPGGQLLVNLDLSDLTRPPAVTRNHYRIRFLGLDLSAYVDICEQRRRIFKQHVLHSPYRELVNQERLLRYIATGIINDDYPGVGLAVAHEHVHHIIDLLRDQENYHLAMSTAHFKSNFAIKPDYGVLWEQRAANGESRLDGIYEGICDTDPKTIAEFTCRFEEAWNAVPAELREKQYVIAWLETQLAEAKAKAEAHPDAFSTVAV